MKITKQVVFIAKEECVVEMKQLLTAMVDASKAEAGCLLYDIFQSIEEPTKFIVIESWEDETALEGHRHSEHYKHYKAHFEPFCADKYSTKLNVL